MERIIKNTFLALVPIFLVCSVNAQYFNYYVEGGSWETGDSEGLAKKYSKKDGFVDQTHIIYESNIRLVYEWDEDEDRPKVEEEGEITVLSLLDYAAYYDGLFQDDNTTVDYVYGVSEYNKSYSLSLYKRSYESSSIFHQDGEYVGFRLPYQYSTFGEVMKYKYQVTYTDLKYLTKTYLQKDEFIREGKIEVWVPKWMDAEVVSQNFVGYGIKRTVKENVKWDEDYEASDREDEKYTVITFEFEDLDPRVVESGSQGSTYYMPHLVHINKSYEYDDESERVFADVNDLYGWYKSLVDNLTIEPTDEIKEIVEELTDGVESDQEKLRNIFYWIQDNVRYIAFEDGIAGFQPEDAEKVCSYRYGDCKGMANLAKVMLTYAGFDARLTWIGTRHIAYTYEIPTLAVDNHMICCVMLDGKKYFIDPTEEFVALNDYAHRIQGRQVLIENGDSFILDKVPEFDANRNAEVKEKKMRIVNGELVGSAAEEYNGESKIGILRGYANVSTQNKEDAITSFLNDDNKNLDISNINLPDFENREAPVKFSYDFTLANNLIDIGDQYLVQLDFDQEFYYFSFSKDRETAYELSSKYYLDNTYTLELPKGASISHLPTNLNIERDGYTFQITVSQRGNTVILRKKIIIEDTVIDLKDMDQWNEDVAAMRAIYDDYLIIKK